MASSKDRRRLELKREKRAARTALRRAAGRLGLPKMSDVLLAFARPLTAGIDDVPLIRSLLQVAAAVWNASSMAVPPEVILAKFDGDEEAKLLVNELIEARR